MSNSKSGITFQRPLWGWLLTALFDIRLLPLIQSNMSPDTAFEGMRDFQVPVPQLEASTMEH